VSPYSCPSNTKLSPDAELLCCALPNIVPSSFFQRSSLLPSSCFYQKDKRTLSANFPIPNSCPPHKFPFSFVFLLFCSSFQCPEAYLTSRGLCFVSYGFSAFLFFRLYGLSCLPCSDVELISETESFVYVGHV
jgi:hypothetical protein